jgi:pimeloyl-ACP methyl ester carboxylesterase
MKSALAALAMLAAGAVNAQALSDCRVAGIRNSVQCGMLQRALDPARPDGPRFDLHYVVVPAMARRKLPDPVFLLAGGPGQSAIGVAPQAMALFSRLNNRRDIVLVDQRGTGRSAPLQCDDPEREHLSDQADPQRQFDLLMQCKAALLKLPYIKAESDLGFFTTTLAMQDLDAVRAALGADTIDLVGISYGTRAGLEYLRQFPSRVRRMVLDAVAPPDMVLPASFSTDSQAALDALLRACDTEPVCHATYPRLRSDWAALLASLPRPDVSAAQPLTGQVERFTLTREIVLGAVRGALYVPSAAAALPAAITAAAAGHVEPLLGLGAQLGSRKGIQLAMGMHFSVVCAEDVPRLASAADPPGADFGRDYAALYQRVCEHWPRGTVPAAFYTTPVSPAPVLLFSGGIDPATPPRHGAQAAAAIGPLAQHVVVPNAGHGVIGIGCAPDLVYRFINAADDHAASRLDASCVKAIPRPGVFIPMSTAPARSAEAAR